jgi:ABC-type branched-subunit amino acid transport system ATPase component
LFNLLNGIVKPNTGTVAFEGEDVTGLKPNQIAKRGIGRTFQVVRAFPRLSVLENVAAGAFVAHVRDHDAWAAAHAVLTMSALRTAPMCQLGT